MTQQNLFYSNSHPFYWQFAFRRRGRASQIERFALSANGAHKLAIAEAPKQNRLQRIFSLNKIKRRNSVFLFGRFSFWHERQRKSFFSISGARLVANWSRMHKELKLIEPFALKGKKIRGERRRQSLYLKLFHQPYFIINSTRSLLISPLAKGICAHSIKIQVCLQSKKGQRSHLASKSFQ